jgi:hypothetical protein
VFEEALEIYFMCTRAVKLLIGPFAMHANERRFDESESASVANEFMNETRGLFMKHTPLRLIFIGKSHPVSGVRILYLLVW